MADELKEPGADMKRVLKELDAWAELSGDYEDHEAVSEIRRTETLIRRLAHEAGYDLTTLTN